MIKIVLGGDTCPIGRNQSFFQKGDVQALLGDLFPAFEVADLRIVNLECPLIEKEAPSVKCGPNLGTPVECVKGLKAMGIDVAGLANNHIMDHGPQGLQTTIKVLEQHGVDHVGAGEDVGEARRILIREVNGLRIGILATAEHEFGIAQKSTPGVNPLDVIEAARIPAGGWY
jgi:poly-gamma-glutamate synthesis protein (capsule biosynthesis protein)